MVVLEKDEAIQMCPLEAILWPSETVHLHGAILFETQDLLIPDLSE